MILFKKAADLRKWLDAQQKKGNSIGFVPTMGALHAGHISLIEQSKKDNPVTVSSIFVNPAQFNDPKDFEKYPITLEKDIALLAPPRAPWAGSGGEAAGCDVLFLPSVKEMYPDDMVGRGVKPARHYDLGYLETVLEGKFRPGHFQGVCMVVHRLLEIVQPDNLYLGQKDYQQCMVITKLIELIQQDKKIKVTICPTFREKNGLAMSSRNMRLKEDERKTAATIYQGLNLIKENFQKENPEKLKQKTKALLEEAGFRIDYVEIADAANLSLISEQKEGQKMIALVAAYMNDVRLIDNLLLN
jgi:pantoate--beta-alanine ligase